MTGALFCSGICAIIFLGTAAATAIDNEFGEQQPSLRCWPIGETIFKLCAEGDETELSDYSTKFQLPKRPSNRLFSPHVHNEPNSPPYYNRRILTDYGGMIVPFFMKRQSYKSSFPLRVTDEEKSEVLLKKRPFDSISFSSGLGGFKK